MPPLNPPFVPLSRDKKRKRRKEMKKTLFLFLGLMVGAVSLVFADTAASGTGSWFIQLNGDMGIPTGHLNDAVNPGWGGEGSIGYHSMDNFDVSVESGYDTYAAKNQTFSGTWNLIPLVLKGQYYFGSDAVKPYLFLGAGVAFNSESASAFGLTGTTNETDFLGEGGLGLAFSLGDKASLFVQGTVEVDTTSSNYSNDSPTVLIPINAGFKFALE
jgi:outer membrane protein W